MTMDINQTRAKHAQYVAGNIQLPAEEVLNMVWTLINNPEPGQTEIRYFPPRKSED
jgi:hypothetical protein